MELDILRQFDATRDFSGKALRSCCYAPYTSLYFDSLGDVRVCCQNTEFVVGNIADDSLDALWHGARLGKLRAALAAGDLSQGCRFCHWQLSEANFQGVFIRNFEHFPVDDPAPAWPVQLEFSVSNTCNLECVMCNGQWSSLIRSRRERLPPLPKPYTERFFQELRPFLPHLEQAKFLGGEPFLAAESLRVWQLMLDDGLNTPCHVTTNGTQYNARVERILERLPISISMSLDGVTKETVEGIRVNASYELLQENFRRFHAYARARGTYIGLTFCLMRQNWHEFARYLLFGDEWDCEVVVNTVTYPRHCSLFTLPPAELHEIVRELEAQAQGIVGQLGRNRGVWDTELARLRRRLGHVEGEQPFFVTKSLADALPHRDQQAADVLAARAWQGLRALAGEVPVDMLVCDRDDVVLESRSESGVFLGIAAETILHRPIQEVQAQLHRQYGPELEVLRNEECDGVREQVLAMRFPNQPASYICGITVPRLDDHGQPLGTLALAVCLSHLPSLPLIGAAR